LVEQFQVIFIVDMKPFCATLPSKLSGFTDKRAADSLPLIVAMNRGVEKESMATSIPRNVDEANNTATIGSTNPTQTMCEHRIPVS